MWSLALLATPTIAYMRDAPARRMYGGVAVVRRRVSARTWRGVRDAAPPALSSVCRKRRSGSITAGFFLSVVWGAVWFRRQIPSQTTKNFPKHFARCAGARCDLEIVSGEHIV